MKTALLGGHVDIAPLSISEALPYLKAKTLKALGVMGSKPIKGFPELFPFRRKTRFRHGGSYRRFLDGPQGDFRR